MTDVRKTSGGSPVSNLAMVSTDQEEIVGNGTSDNPLRLGPGVGKTEFEAAFSGESSPQIGQAVAMVIDATPPTTVQAASAAGAFLAIGVVTAILDDSQVRVRSGGIVELTTAQWDGVTGGSGGLEPGAAYYVSSAGDGHLTATAPSDPDVVSQVGVALDETRLLLQFMVATGAVGLAAIAFSGSATDLVAGTVPVARVGDGSLVNAKLANMPAHTIKGNDTGSAAAPQDLTAGATKNLLAITATDVSGLAQIAITGNGANLADNSVSDAKLVVMPTLTIKGNNTGGISAPSNLTVNQVVAMLSLTPGDITGLAAIATTGSADDLVAGHVPAGRMPALTGAVTTTIGNVATTITAHAVANAQLAQVPAHTLKGNNTGALADVADLTVNQVVAMLSLTPGDITGLAAIATTGSADDLVAGHVPAARMPALTGDVTTTIGNVATTITANSVITAKIADAAATNAKLADMPAQTIKGNNTLSAGVPLDLTIAQVLTLLGISPLGSTLGQFGPGTDGNVTMSGGAVPGTTLVGSVYTATRSLFCDNLTIAFGFSFRPNGYSQYVKGVLTNNGTYDCRGENAVGSAAGIGGWDAGSRSAPLPSGGTGGVGGTSPGNNGAEGVSQAGGVRIAATLGPAGGTTGNPGTIGGQFNGGSGGGGGLGLGSFGGNGGSFSSLLSELIGDFADYLSAIQGRPYLTTTMYVPGCGGGGGGCGGGVGGGIGGGGGAAAGWCVLYAYSFAGGGTYIARGGNGADAAAATANGGGGGGGGGGSGAMFVLITASKSPPTVDVTGGSPGAGSAGSGTSVGNPGAIGGTGGPGLYLVYN